MKCRGIVAKVMFGVMGLGLGVTAQAADFTYDTQFSQSGTMVAAEFPLTFSNLQQGDITGFTIYKVDGATLTDVTTLGCGVSSSYSAVNSFIASSSGVNADFSATCATGVTDGDNARVVVSVNAQHPLVLAAGPRNVAADASTKVSWLHDSGFFQCQPFTLNMQHAVWSSANFSLTSQITSSTQGSTSLVAASSPSTVSFALQCISFFGFGMPPVAVVDVNVN